MALIYLIGSLRNPKIPALAKTIREAGFDVFDDWYSPGPETDDRWRDYEKARGRSYIEALEGAHAVDVFEFDMRWLKAADAAVLALPAGKSGHMELGWMRGQGKPGFILLDEMERWDIMYKIATGVHENVHTLIQALMDLSLEKNIRRVMR